MRMPVKGTRIRNRPPPSRNGNSRVGPANSKRTSCTRPARKACSSQSIAFGGIVRPGRYFAAARASRSVRLRSSTRRGESPSAGSQKRAVPGEFAVEAGEAGDRAPRAEAEAAEPAAAVEAPLARARAAREAEVDAGEHAARREREPGLARIARRQQ